jgi:prepilin-type processing-associated H-X9-DG protein
MSNELGTPNILICPSDERNAHSNFVMDVTGIAGPQQAVASAANTTVDNDPAYFNNFKLSYFLGVNALDAPNPQMLLAGDRNIWGDHYGGTTQPAWNGNGYGNINSTQYYMGTNWPAGSAWPQWSPTKMHQSRGNVLLADGSVQQLNSQRLRQLIAINGDTTPTAGTSAGPNIFLFP